QEAHRWDCTTQQWVSATQPRPGVFVGDDFAVNQGAGYFVKVGGAAQWCIGTCDTLPTDIPDLLVTQYDIVFQPNPALINTEVTLALNVKNIGADTAFNPTIAFYNGDPDFGGTLLAFGPLPVDIPPGGQSNFWSFGVTFAIPGVYQIYGVADHSDQITELDETNNSTFATLTITGAAVATPDDTRKGLPATLAAIATNERSDGPVQFRYLPDITPAPLVLDNRGSRENIRPALSKPGSHHSLAAAATISQVTASNQSSASATITWVTQEVVDGCVRYGIAPGALNDTVCSLEPDGYVHVVQITGLAPAATYFYEVVSDSTVDNNSGAAYQFATAAVGAGLPYVVYGAVLQPDGLTPAFSALVTATVTSGGAASHPLSVLTSVTGTWSLNLGNLKDPLTGNPLAYQPGDSITIAVESGPDGSGFDTALVAGISPQDADTVVLAGGSCCDGIRGDVNFDGLAEADIVDLSFLVDFLWQGGADPACLDEANLDGSGDDVVDIVDLTYLVDFLWQGGPPPPSCP
ncbi:MAG: fibronectin type III domain-containing protein, partial [Candidatus Zixiibacteriota bacterium]